MKSCDQMAESVFCRIQEYKISQARKRKTIMRAAASTCCVCFAALLSVGVWQVGKNYTAKPDARIENTTVPVIKDTLSAGKERPIDVPALENKIIVHPIDGISADRMNICLGVDDFVEMTQEEMIAYYGVDYFPDVPADLQPWEDQRSGVYKRNGGTGEVYWDADVLNYSNADLTRNVNIEVDKGNKVLLDYVCFKGNEEYSMINNVEVLIGQSPDGYYYAEFMYHDVGFHFIADGLSEEEFVSVIASVLK